MDHLAFSAINLEPDTWDNQAMHHLVAPFILMSFLELRLLRFLIKLALFGVSYCVTVYVQAFLHELNVALKWLVFLVFHF